MMQARENFETVKRFLATPIPELPSRKELTNPDSIIDTVHTLLEHEIHLNNEQIRLRLAVLTINELLAKLEHESTRTIPNKDFNLRPTIDALKEIKLVGEELKKLASDKYDLLHNITVSVKWMRADKY